MAKCGSFLLVPHRQGEHHSIRPEAHAAHTYGVPVSTCQQLTSYHALPTAAARALNLMVSKYSRNRADNETRYPLPSMPQQPRPAFPHTRDALLRDFLSHSFTPPHSFIPPWSPFCQSARRDANLSPKPGRVPSPFMQMLHH